GGGPAATGRARVADVATAPRPAESKVSWLSVMRSPDSEPVSTGSTPEGARSQSSVATAWLAPVPAPASGSTGSLSAVHAAASMAKTTRCQGNERAKYRPPPSQARCPPARPQHDARPSWWAARWCCRGDGSDRARNTHGGAGVDRCVYQFTKGTLDGDHRAH